MTMWRRGGRASRFTQSALLVQNCRKSCREVELYIHICIN